MEFQSPARSSERLEVISMSLLEIKGLWNAKNITLAL